MRQDELVVAALTLLCFVCAVSDYEVQEPSAAVSTPPLENMRGLGRKKLVTQRFVFGNERMCKETSVRSSLILFCSVCAGSK